MEFKKYKMAMRNRISPKNRDFVIDRERAPFDDNVSGLGEQPVFSQNEFTTTPMIDPAEFPARKEYMQSYATGGNVRQLYEEGGFVKITKEIEKELNSKNITPARRYQLKNTLQFISKLKKESSSVKGSKKIENLILKKDQLGRRFFSDYLEKLNALKDLQKGKYKNIKTGKVYSPEEWISLDATTRGKMRDPESFLDKKSKYQREYMSSKKKDPEFLEEFKLRKKEEYYSKERKKRQETKLSNNGRGVLLERRNNLLGYMSEAAKRGNPDFKEIIEDGKFLGVKDVANNINYYEAGYKGKLGKNSKLINSHPDYDNLKALNTLANKFKTETPNKAISSYFSAYERVPTYSEMYNFLQADPRFMKNISPRFFQTNALHKHHLISVTDSPTNKIMLLLQDKNDQAGKRMEEFKKGIITEDKLNKELKKLNARYVVNGKPLGAALTSPETQLKTAKTQTTKLFKQKLSENPNLVQEMTDRIGVQLLGTIGCSNTAQVSPRDKLTRVKNSIGGRIGFKEGSSCVEKGKKKIEEGKIGKSELNAVERSLEQSGKMTPDAKKYFTGAKVALKAGAKLPLELISVGFGPAGVVAGALLELATVQDDFMRGDLKEAWRNSFPGMILKGAENLVGVNITGTKETDVLKFAKTDEEIAAVKNMFSYLKGTDKYNERVEKLDRLAGDITDDVDADPEAQMISSSSAQSYYDVEEQAKKLKAILDAQEKTLGTAEGQKMSIDVLRREIASRYNRALTNVSLEQFIDDEINRIYFDIQKQAAPTSDVVDPDTQFNLMNSVRQPFAGGGLSIQDKIQELLASIPGLMMADFVPVSEKVELKRLFDQFNDRYMRKAEGGRIGFKNGPEDINKSKRLFTQLLVGLAALPIVGKYLKLGRGAAKVTNVNIPNVPGMPEFFQPLVNKVINEGIDLTTKLGTQERQIVRKADIAGHEVTVYHQLETGETDVYINGMKTLYQDAVRLYYKPGQVSEEASKASGKIVKEPDEFIAQESSPAYSGSPEDYEITSDGTFETNNFNELASDLSEVEAAVLKQPVSELQKRKKLERLKYYESKEGQQKLLDEQYGEYDDTMRDDIIDE
jgi:hypothetical protein